MATTTRVLAAVTGRSAVGQGGLAVLSSASCHRRGGGAARSFSNSSTAEREREREGHADADDATAEQVEAALNRKNVEVVQGDGRSATLLPDDAADALRGVGSSDDADDAWVPDQETGVFVPADEASSGDGDGNGTGAGGGGERGMNGPSVLDQAVFVREEEMEDVERPAAGAAALVDVADDAGAAAE